MTLMVLVLVYVLFLLVLLPHFPDPKPDKS